MFCKLVVIATGVACIQTLKLPSYMVPCRLSDPKFRECAMEHGQNALPELLKGDKSRKIPVLDPLTFPKFTLSTGGNLVLDMANTAVTGLANLIITDFQVDEEAKVITLSFSNENVKLVGDYTIDGQLLILPLTGHGKANLTFVDGILTYEARYNLLENGGKTYMNITDTETKFSLRKCYINLENLFNGDNTLGPQMNHFLNENCAEIINEFRDSITTTFDTLFTTVTVNICHKVPFDHIFLK